MSVFELLATAREIQGADYMKGDRIRCEKRYARDTDHMPDGVVFLADCISSRETLDKYAVSFIYDVGAYLETLDMVEGMEAAMFVPAHAEASADIKELVRYNRDKVHEVAEKILSICKEPICFELGMDAQTCQF